MNRRKFIRNSSLANAGVTILNFPMLGKNVPNNKVIVAVMGINGRAAFPNYKTNPLETEIETCRRSKYLLPVSFRIPVLTF
jgi:hypothetical protein